MSLSPVNFRLWSDHIASVSEGEGLLLRGAEAFGPRFFSALNSLLDAARREGAASPPPPSSGSPGEVDRLRAALEETRRLVGNCALTGFTDEDDIRALYVNNGAITQALAASRPADGGEPKPGEIRVINGQRCRFIERELEGDKWEVL